MHKILIKIFINIHHKKTTSNLMSGFTLVELMVVISIFMVISSLVIFNYGDFRSKVSLQNLTDDIALSVRKAQSFAIGARAIGTDFSNSYGVHFALNTNLPTPLAGSNKSFLMFSSIDKVYDDSGRSVCGDGASTSINECVELFKITTADIIKSIKSSDGTIATSGSSSSLDISFTRPNPRAYFCFKPNGATTCSLNVTSVDIIVSNGLSGTKEKTRTISVQNTGQISIQ